MFKRLKKAAATAVRIATPVAIATVAPEALLNVAGGAVLKHRTKIDNQQIPVANAAVSTLVSYGLAVLETHDPIASIPVAIERGGFLTGMSWGIHQSVKQPLARVTGRSV